MAVKEVSNSPVTATGRAYQTSDGRQFSSRSAAEAHEASLSRSSGTSSATSSATRSSTSSSRSSGGGGGSRSYTSPPGGSLGANVAGYDPNWFRSLSPEIQRLVQQERQRAGYAPLPTDRPLSFEESMRGVDSIRWEDVRPEIQDIIRQREKEAIGAWQNELLLEAIQRKMAQLEQQSAYFQIPQIEFPEFPQIKLPAPTPPPKIEAEPKVEGVQPAPAPPEPASEKLPEGVRRGQAGFERLVAPVRAPDVDKLLEIYEEVFGPVEGRQEEYVRQYLGSPHFQRILGGAVPMWMETDPLWRLYLHRLGLLREAVGRRLAAS